jgi:Protein of unknown function (DUF3618)
VATDPEELLRSIERTREELALTVDTIASRLDPKKVARRSVGKARAGFDAATGIARRKLDTVAPAVRRAPKPVAGGGLAALLALAAVIAARRRRR